MHSLQTVAEPQISTTNSAPAITSRGRTVRRSILLLALSLAAIAIDGYHPYGEDAGIYVSGIKQIANPVLYGSGRAFNAPYLRLSLFSRWNARLSSAFHIPLPWLLMAMQIATTWLLLYACFGLARRCFPAGRGRLSASAQWASVSLVAACLSIPVAGSSLFMMDPYLTSRSFSTPLTLLAICACLDRKLLRAALFIALSGVFHPLMTLYSLGFVLLLWAVIRQSWIGAASLVAAALASGAVVQFSQRAINESAAYQAAVVTRFYFFLYRWKWYELLGVIAPLALFALYVYWQRQPKTRESLPQNGVAIGQTCILLGITSIAVSLLYARPNSHSHLISALQPLRPFLYIYFCMFILLGGLLGQYLLKQRIWAWIPLFASITAGLAFVQHSTYPASAQVELPWVVSSNGWNRAFVWIRDNTPSDSLVALDADYIHAPGEDSQGFRAIAERNAMADRAKDGGAAAVFPELADRWMREHTAITNLNQIGDTERRRRLAPFHVTWVVLEPSTVTGLPCPFQDDLAKVCRLN